MRRRGGRRQLRIQQRRGRTSRRRDCRQRGQGRRRAGESSPSKPIFNASSAETKKAFGRLDILVNNAGVYEFAPLEDVTAEHFHKMFDLNVLGLILASQEAVKQFGPAGGSIINISSVAATAALPTASVYSATKAAVDAVTRSLAKELGPRKIRVNSINPGMIETEGAARRRNYAKAISASRTKRRRRWAASASPRTSRRRSSFSLRPTPAWITGETLYITGGLR